MHVLRFLLLFPLVLPVACEAPAGATPQHAPGPVEVGVVTLEPTSVTLTRELPGRVSALRVSEVRARVDGLVEARLFEEGSDVEEGQLLYRIEAAPYQAALAQARANLARAEATAARLRLTAQREEALVATHAVSQEEYDNSVASLRAAEAEVAASKAAVKAAQIDLAYTKVRAPVSGRIGRSEVTEGAYVQRQSATLLATIQQLDTVYVDITQSAAEVLRLRRDLESNELKRDGDAAQISLVLEDGRVYGEVGTLQFADATVDQSTGSIYLRALFPNPDGMLLPGMFVRARLEQGTDPSAILVPQRAVTRDPKGQATALVVDANGVVERRTLIAERAVGNNWLVTEGLEAGERVIVEGLQKVKPGDEVTVASAERSQDSGELAAAKRP